MKISLAILILDFIAACSFISIGILSSIDGYYLPMHQLLCDFNSIIYLGSVYLSSWFVGLVSLERGLLIIHSIKLSPNFWIITMLIEVLYFLVCNLVVIGIGQMELVTLALYCLGSPDTWFGTLTIISYAIMMWLSFCFVIYSYIGIAITMRRRTWKEIRELNRDPKQALEENNKVIVRVLVLLMLYLSTNTLELFNTTRELITGVPRTAYLDLISTTLNNISPIINSMLLIQLHEKVRESLIKMFPFLRRFLLKSLDTKEANMRDSVIF
jgi:hypothetical protein